MVNGLDMPPARPMTTASRQTIRRTLERAVGQESGVKLRRRWARPAVVAAAAGAVLAASAGGATAYVMYAPATDHVTIRCYTEASLGHGGHFKGTEAGQPMSNGPRSDAEPIEICASFWRAGILKPDAEHAVVPTGEKIVEYPVPPLAACTYKGVAAVFPGDSHTCERLGLPQYQPGSY